MANVEYCPNCQCLIERREVARSSLTDAEQLAQIKESLFKMAERYNQFKKEHGIDGEKTENRI